MTSTSKRGIRAFAGLLALAGLLSLAPGCSYRFADITIPVNIHTVRVQQILNHAPYVNPQLAQLLSERLRQKISNQTRLTQTNSETPNMDIAGVITDYSVSTSGVSNTTGRSQSSINRLTVTVQFTITDNVTPNSEPRQVSASRSFDFSANQSLQTAEAQLLDEMVRNLTDEIFNNIFSSW